MISYYEWLINLIGGSKRWGREYSKVLYQLYSTPFYAVNPMDANRCSDGEGLRSRYGGFDSLPDSCTVLELMISLAERIDNVVWDGETRYDIWFWDHLFKNLELENMDDAHYDPYYVEYVTCRLISRSYEPDGQGGLFYVPNPPEDLRKVQIWYQMCWYIDNIT